MQKTFIFIGDSGSGKGTQSKKLCQYLKGNKEDVLYMETGSGFRDFFQRTSETSDLAREINDRGELEPEFLAIYIWADIFVRYFSKERSIVIDGTPRKIREAHIFDNALKFYDVKKPHVIFLNISREEAKKRLLTRGRVDDSKDKIENRLNWFKIDVLKSIEFFRNNDYYEFHEVNGEQNIEDIFEEILKKTKLK